MTTGNEDVKPKPDNDENTNIAAEGQQQPPAPGDEGAEGKGLNFTVPQPEDVDDIELEELRKAAKAEEAGEAEGDKPGDVKPGETQTGKTATPKPAPTEGDQNQQGQKPAPVMIPKERLDEALGKTREAETAAAYWRGVAEARAQPAQPGQAGQAGQQQQQQQATPEDRLAILHSEQDKLAKQFDEGEITYSQLTAKQRDLNNQEQTIREEIVLSKVKPAAPAQASDPLYLETLTAQLEEKHPWTAVLSEFAEKSGSNAEWDYLKTKAIDNLTQKGIDPRAGEMGRYELRREMAELCDQLGPALVGDKARALGIATPGQAKAPGQQQQQQPTAEQREAALKKGEKAPPNLRSMGGSPDAGDGTPTESRLEEMSEDEIGNMPDSVRRKILGIT